MSLNRLILKSFWSYLTALTDEVTPSQRPAQLQRRAFLEGIVSGISKAFLPGRTGQGVVRRFYEVRR